MNINDLPHFADDRITQVTDFPFGDIDLSEQPNSAKHEFREDSIAAASDAVADLLRWVWSPPDPQVAIKKFVAISAVMRPDLVNETYSQLGKKLGCTKASISQWAVKFQKEFGIHFRRSRRLGGCKNMSIARLNSYAKQKADKNK